MKHWRLDFSNDGIAWLTFDQVDSRVNTLGVETLNEFEEALALCEREPLEGLVIRSAKADGFAAGADVKAFADIPTADEVRQWMRQVHGILLHLEALRFPSVALIRGHCLGGGLELALACGARVATSEPGTRLGFPEVRLGIFPGFGGTARAIRQLGHLPALQLMLTGRSVSGKEARRLRLVDDCVPLRHLETSGLALLRQVRREHKTDRLLRIPGWPVLRPVVASWLKRTAAKRANPEHYPAPGALIDHWRAHGADAEALLQGEIETVPELLTAETSRCLVRAFMLREHLRHQGSEDLPSPRHLHVIGAGVMGTDIAAWAVSRGLRVSIHDQGPAPLARAMARGHAFLKQALRDPLRVRDAMDRLLPDLSGDGVRRADVVLEAIIEDVGAKQAVYRQALPRMKEGALLATNTSSIPLQSLAEGLDAPGRLVGLHFFNPVARMPLVEVIRAPFTEPAVVQAALAFTRTLGKVPLLVKSSPGFLVNRILMPYLLEAVALFEEGTAPEAIDRAAEAFGMPMGPIELADTVGLDICLSVAGKMPERLGAAAPESLRSRVAAGQLGRKTGKGFYSWPRRRSQRRQGKPFTQEQQDRLILRMLNEVVACRREAIVDSEDELDAGVLFGTGFAPFRGGPLRYVRKTGAQLLQRRLLDLEQRFGARFRPDAGWSDLTPGGT